MAKYVLDMTKPHRQSLIELVNNDNAATIGTPLTLADVVLKGERAVDKVGESIDREFAVTLENAKYAADVVEVYFNKVELADVMTMTIDDGDFDWYVPDEWDLAVDGPEAIAAFKVAATRATIDADAALEGLTVDRSFNAEQNRYFLDFSLTSFVFHDAVSFQMPKHFSEIITVTELNGFIYSPIQPGDVVE